MTKSEFFEVLERKLQNAPEPERTELIQSYEEYFKLALASGQTEEEIVRSILEPDGASDPESPSGGFGTASDSAKPGEAPAGFSDPASSSAAAGGSDFTIPGADRYKTVAGSTIPGAGGQTAAVNGYSAAAGGVFSAGHASGSAWQGADIGHPPADVHAAPGQAGQAAARPERESPLRMIMLGALLAVFNLVFVFAPFLAICATLFALGLAGAVMVAFPFIYYWVNGLPAASEEMLFAASVLLAILGAGVAVSVAVSYLAPAFFRLMGKYAALNVKAIRGY